MPAPTVTTSAATGITPVKATLNGTVNPNGLSTDYWFERWRDDWEAAGEAFRENLEVSGRLTEADEGSWSTGGTASKDFENTDVSAPVTGLNVAKLVRTASGTGNIQLSRVNFDSPVEPGSTYITSVYVRPTVERKVLVRLVQSTGATIAAKEPTCPANEWTRIDLSAENPAGNEGVLTRVFVRDAANGEVAYIAGFLLEEGNELGSVIPRLHQLESGQAVETEVGTYKLATPTNHPASKEGDAGAGEVAVEVPETAEGLSGGKEYHFRLYAENADGEAFGEDKTFATIAGATAPPASATASAPAPEVIAATVIAVTAQATASAPAPSVMPEILIAWEAATATASAPIREIVLGNMPSTTENYKGLPLPYPSVLANPDRLGPPRFTSVERRRLGI